MPTLVVAATLVAVCADGGRVARGETTTGQAAFAASAPASSLREQRDFLRPPRVPGSPLDEITLDGRPTEAGIAVLRAHARGRTVRLQVGGTGLVVTGAGFDSAGVTFSAVRAHGSQATGGVALGGAVTGPVASPIRWTDIERIETGRSSALKGAIMGAFLGALAGAMFADAAGSEPGPGIILVFAFPPGGAVLGAVVGASLPHWQHEWPPPPRR